LSRPTPYRHAPITTTGLGFNVYLSTEGVAEMRLIA
jgi:hypothetical protein